MEAAGYLAPVVPNVIPLGDVSGAPALSCQLQGCLLWSIEPSTAQMSAKRRLATKTARSARSQLTFQLMGSVRRQGSGSFGRG
jgi:hypothetical protein